MPEWLKEKDNYIPSDDKNAFIDKSILSILNVLTKVKKQTQHRANLFGISALVKFISVLVFIAFVSLSRSFSFVLITNVLLLVLINFLGVNEIKYILIMSLTAAIFTFILLLPSIYFGYGNNSLMITLKVLVSVISVNILACTTQWNDLIRALKAVHMPDIFILVFDITIKYILILGEFSLNMIYALKIRSVGKSSNNNKTVSLSGIIGTMVIKSVEMADEMYSAMECRGFTGEYRAYSKVKLRLADYICILFDLAFILIYFYFDRL